MLSLNSRTKKYVGNIMVILCTLLLSSCTFTHTVRWIQDSEEIMSETLEKMLTAVQSEDKKIFSDLFSKTVYENDEEFERKVDDFFAFVEGNIIEFGVFPGVSASSMSEGGKRKKELCATCWVETSEKQYYIAIRECTVDTFNEDNVGIKSIYIIDADMWMEDYEYGGDGNWTWGINIE